jgi:DNA polymerase I-like protein with 3'-5' exonuclease and polymerase domains
MPSELPDLRRCDSVSFDTETSDDGLRADRGSAWPWKGGYICGVSVAWREGGDVRSLYIPLRHPDSENLDRANVIAWLKDLFASSAHIITQNGLYDYGWAWADFGLAMPPADRLEEIGASATLINENLFSYSLDALCKWRGLPGKDTALLQEACKSAGWKLTKKNPLQSHIWELPAHLVGPYAEADARSTLALFENLNPILDFESTLEAYRLECDLLPMVHEMRRRGLRVDQSAAEQEREYCLGKRDAALAELSQHLGTQVSMAEIASPKWKAQTFDAHNISYPRTAKGNPSFKAGKLGWMAVHKHWLPQLITAANRYDAAGSKFLEGHILSHIINGRIYSEINPHRSENGGAKSFRFSYSNPPLQQMPSRDAELAPRIRRVFLPEEGEFWCTDDCSQQEFRLVVHEAAKRNLPGAAAARDAYRNNPDTDIHQWTSDLAHIPRTDAKAMNFAKIYGAGPEKIAEMLGGRSLAEAKNIIAQYDAALPFVAQLSKCAQREANIHGYTLLYDGARRHWNRWSPRYIFAKGAGPCEHEEAKQRIRDPGHPWFGGQLEREDVYTALNALIQGSAARHTKLWMRACWREGIVPLLQMHDGLELSVSSQEQGELVARLACEAVQLAVPMRAEMKFGHTWGDATHTWGELQNGTTPIVEAVPLTPETEPEPAEDLTVELDTVTVAAVPFMITRTMKAQLQALGCSDADIVEMTPQQAHDLLGPIATAPIAPTAPPIAPPPGPIGNGTASASYATKTNGSAPHTAGGGGGTNSGYPCGESETGHKVAEFIYRDLKGKPFLKVAKYRTKAGKKSFPQYHWGNGRWAKDKPKGPAVPYRLPELLAAPAGSAVWICEGEKDAETLAALGLIATTNPGGAGKWQPELAKWLAGFTTAYVLEDNDAAGRKHVLQVAAALSGVVPDIRVVTFRELPEHGDVTDWMKGKTLADLLTRAEQAPRSTAIESVCAADEEITALDWLWYGRFALGKIGLLVGLPDEGKGLTLSDIIARVTRGAAWPCNEGEASIGNVLLLTAEDDINDTIIPRLIAAGADLTRVTIVKMLQEAGAKRMFSLVTDLPALRQKVLEVGGVKLIVVDPISAYLGIGKIDSFRATDVRAVLGPLKELAEALHLLVLGVMHFNKKTDITNVVLRISDSLAFGAAARHVYGIVNDPDNNRKLLVKGKNNLAPKDQQTLAFGFATREVGIDKKTGAPISAPYIMWPGYRSGQVAAAANRRRSGRSRR